MVLMSEMILVAVVFALICPKPTTNEPAKMPIMITVIRSSTKVKPFDKPLFEFKINTTYVFSASALD